MTKWPVVNCWFISSNNSYMNDVITLFVDLFEKNHPRIKINLERKNWNTVWEELLDSKETTQAPDIVQIGSTWVSYLGQHDYLLALNDKVDEVGGAAAFEESIFKSCVLPKTGEINALPWFIDTRGFYYRDDILATHNLTPKDVSTWDLLIESCKKINNFEINHKNIPALGLGSGLKSAELLHNVMPFVWSAGGDIYNEDTREVVVNSAETLKGMEFFFDLFKQGFVPLHCLQLDPAQLTVEYFQGAFSLCVTNVIDVFSMAYSESFYNIDIAKHCQAVTFPTGPKGGYSFAGGSALGILKNSTVIAEAWEFIKFLTSVEAQIYYAKSCGAIPAVKKAFQSRYFLTNQKFAAFKEILKTARYYPVLSQWGKIEEIMVNSLFKIYYEVAQNQGKYDKLSLRREMNQAAGLIKEILKLDEK